MKQAAAVARGLRAISAAPKGSPMKHWAKLVAPNTAPRKPPRTGPRVMPPMTTGMTRKVMDTGPTRR